MNKKAVSLARVQGMLEKLLIDIYIYIYKLFKETFFLKSVIFPILQIFNGLLQTKSVKKYILTE